MYALLYRVHGYHQTPRGVRIEWEERVIIMMVKRGGGWRIRPVGISTGVCIHTVRNKGGGDLGP
jgi:hypothetical protein